MASICNYIMIKVLRNNFTFLKLTFEPLELADLLVVLLLVALVSLVLPLLPDFLVAEDLRPSNSAKLGMSRPPSTVGRPWGCGGC